MNKLKCPNCFKDLRPMLDRIGASEDLHAGNYVLCDEPSCEQLLMVVVESGEKFLAKVERVDSD